MKISELLTDESKWTKGAYARDKFGEKVSSINPEAVCWCMSGAALKLEPRTKCCVRCLGGMDGTSHRAMSELQNLIHANAASTPRKEY